MHFNVGAQQPREGWIEGRLFRAVSGVYLGEEMNGVARVEEYLGKASKGIQFSRLIFVVWSDRVRRGHFRQCFFGMKSNVLLFVLLELVMCMENKFRLIGLLLYRTPKRRLKCLSS